MKLFIKNLIFTLAVPGIVAVFIPLSLVSDGPVRGWSTVIGFIILGCGGAVYLWCLWDFATFGRGTPAPIDAPKRLVVRGLYKYTRNPMYVGVLSTILGWSVLFGAPRSLLIYLAFVATMFHLVVVLYEEPHLSELFGSEYSFYRTKVGRWIPKGRFRSPES